MQTTHMGPSALGKNDFRAFLVSGLGSGSSEPGYWGRFWGAFEVIGEASCCQSLLCKSGSRRGLLTGVPAAGWFSWLVHH